MAVLHRITPELTQRYKAVRLRALVDSPMAFGSTYERERVLSEEDWNQRAQRLDGEQAAGYIAADRDADCGLAVCFLDEAGAPQADLISMWVAPECRRTKVGADLVQALSDWAANRGAGRLRLMVTSNNEAAIKFYERIGFRKTGRTEPYPNDASLFEYEMVKPLR